MIKQIKNEDEMKFFGRLVGEALFGGEIIELIGDVGAGKTTFAKGLALGLGINEEIQSPSFNIKRLYDARDGLIMEHYDFYRLADAGIMANEIEESIDSPKSIILIEWGDIVDDILPEDRLTIGISSPTEFSRSLDIKSNGVKSQKILDRILL